MTRLKTEGRATVIAIVPESISEPDAFTGKRYSYGGYVEIELEDGRHYNLMNGSINGVRQPVQVGDTGRFQWRNGGCYSLPIFIPQEG